MLSSQNIISNNNSNLDEILMAELKAFPNVTDASLGLRTRQGKFTEEEVIVVYVSKKINSEYLDPKSIIPKQINGIPTDVQLELSTADLRLSNLDRFDAHNFDLTRKRPLESGIAISTSIAPDFGGTLGCFATRNSDGKTVLISNYHVLFRNTGLPGLFDSSVSFVYQPIKNASNLIATIPEDKAGFIGSNVDLEGSVDCAYALLEEEKSCCCTKHVIEHKNRVDTIEFNGISKAGLNQKVFKKGIATGLTTGKIVNPGKDISGAVDYSDYFLAQGDSFEFSNVILIVYWDEAENKLDSSKPFSSSGDSGAVVYNEQNEIIGLHFSTFETEKDGEKIYVSIACHIEFVQKALKVTILGTHNYQAKLEVDLVPELAELDIPIDTSSGGFSPAGTKLSAELDKDNWWENFESEIRNTSRGRFIMEIMDQFGFEIMRLVNGHRIVAVTWHRIQGPSFIASFTRAIKQVGLLIPKTIKNKKLENCSIQEALATMFNVLHTYGSAELKLIIDKYRALFLEVAEKLPDTFTSEDLIEYLNNNSVKATENG